MGTTVARERVEARVSAEEKALLEEAARRQGQTLSAFLIASAHEAAVRTIETYALFSLAREDQKAFVEALLNPDEPGPRLKRAAHRYLRAKGRR